MTRIEDIRSSGQLPSPKGVALAIMEICQREDASLSEVARIVQTDPALSGRLLQLANSASQSGRAVVSINEAVMRLGMSVVRMHAMGFSLVDQYAKGPCRKFDYQGFWSHSLLMAVACQELGSVVRVGTSEDLFACGLLAQIGKLSLATIYPDEYAAIMETGAEDEALMAIEREHLELDHAYLTASILADIGIPRVLAEPVFFHESPHRSGFAEGSRPYMLTQLFFLARQIANLGLADETDRHGRISELMRLGAKIGLDAEALGLLFDRVVVKWLEWSVLLKVPASNLPSFNAMASAPAPRLETESIASPKKRVLLVEDEPTTRLLTESVLRQLLNCEVYSAENGKDALSLALQVMPQIVITDWLMPGMDGLEFCRALRSTDWGQSMYVIMLTGEETEEKIVEAFEAGVDDYVTKPVNTRALNARMRAAMHYVKLLESWEKDRAQLKQFAAELAITNRRLERTAMTDLLTGLPNRRAGMEALAKAWSNSERTNQPLAVLILDIDRFKSINDRYGHATGDVVLQKVAKAIESSARRHDSVCRMGGEEFMIVCHDADSKSALVVADRLLKTVRNLKIEIEGHPIQTSISIGIANREMGMTHAEEMINGADKALYSAKNSGRDQACLLVLGKTQRIVISENINHAIAS
jgi:diguanylate cyclase (GGDEF)-like protein